MCSHKARVLIPDAGLWDPPLISSASPSLAFSFFLCSNRTSIRGGMLNNEMGRKGEQGKGCETEGNPDIAPQTSKERIGNYVRQMRHLPYFLLWVYNQIASTSPISVCVYRMS